MKKIIIGLLVIAAGATAYYLYTQKKTTDPATEKKQEMLLGKWKTSSKLSGPDSLLSAFQYEFRKDGIGFIHDSTTAKSDSFYYEWNKTGDLVVKGNVKDSTAEIFSVLQLNHDSLRVKNNGDKENKEYHFTRL